jgi:hypothetical protein
MTTVTPLVLDAAQLALKATVALALSHTACVAIIMYLDLSGRWKEYAMNPNRTITARTYLDGLVSFSFDLGFLFFPFMTWCFWYRWEEITRSSDSLFMSLTKLALGYVLGKIWAYHLHVALHHPALYHFHRRHHKNTKVMTAASAWEDSMVEYMIMELPSFGITVLLFPTHFVFHLVHFCWHGWDGACGHCGFKAPGILGYIFDGEYHYYHHAHLTVNYAEVEFLDVLFGTHHTQLMQPKKEVCS